MTTANPSPEITFHTYIAGKNTNPVTTADFVALLKACSLGARRPLDNAKCIDGMLQGSNLVASAWRNNPQGKNKLIAVARAMSDFHYACYLADLAVDDAHQKQGLGKHLIHLISEANEPTCKIILMAAPAANDYYAPLGFEHNPRCWVLPEKNATYK